jgi:hypothetical protein
MVVAGGFEANDHAPADIGQICCKAIVISLGGHHRHPPRSPALRALDENLLPVLGHIDGYQHGGGAACPGKPTLMLSIKP